MVSFSALAESNARDRRALPRHPIKRLRAAGRVETIIACYLSFDVMAHASAGTVDCRPHGRSSGQHLFDGPTGRVRNSEKKRSDSPIRAGPGSSNETPDQSRALRSKAHCHV